MEFIEYVKKIDPNVTIIVDGAQAVGNIHVGEKDLDNADFYITSSHKWLCGKTALGFVCSDPVWSIEDYAQGYSGKSGASGTGIIGALISARLALKDFNRERLEAPTVEKHIAIKRMKQIEEHNIALAHKFYSDLGKCGLIPASPKPSCGIVSFDASDQLTLESLKNEELILSCIHKEEFPHSKLNPDHWGGRRFYVSIDDLDNRRNPFKKFKLEHSFPLPSEPVWRACFHYYQREQDVENLLTVLKKLMGSSTVS